MKINRTGEVYSSGRLLENSIYVRHNLTPVIASEWYYTYVGEYSYLPISDLLYPEDGELLKKEAEAYTAPVELLTGITNRREGYRTVYLRMESSDQTEDGVSLFRVVIYDMIDMEERTRYLEHQVMKYRHLLGMNNQYYYEYTIPDNKINVYKYMNAKALNLYEMDLNRFAELMDEEYGDKEEQREEMQRFCAYLKNATSYFEMEFDPVRGRNDTTCLVKGGTLYKNRNVVAGVILPSGGAAQEAYYLTPAGRDAGTGIFNKRAATEYAEEKLQQQDDTPRWFMMMDIDNFKEINDSFGHLFGDEVIRRTANILQQNVGLRGIIGRFGGDEFFVMLEKVATREEVRNLLKTIVKELKYTYDPKFQLTVSVGVTQYPKDGDTYEELMEKADKALYIAKEKGKDRHVIYEEAEHEDYWKEGMPNRLKLATKSREERRGAVLDILGKIHMEGIKPILEKGTLLKNVCQMYGLDGITVYSDFGRKVAFRWGEYQEQPADGSVMLSDAGYVKLFGHTGILVESNMLKLKAIHPAAYKRMKRQNIGAAIQCLTSRENVPCVLVNFDVFGHNRKWSDAEIEILGIIGCHLGRMICEQEEL